MLRSEPSAISISLLVDGALFYNSYGDVCLCVFFRILPRIKASQGVHLFVLACTLTFVQKPGQPQPQSNFIWEVYSGTSEIPRFHRFSLAKYHRPCVQLHGNLHRDKHRHLYGHQNLSHEESMRQNAQSWLQRRDCLANYKCVLDAWLIKVVADGAYLRNFAPKSKTHISRQVPNHSETLPEISRKKTLAGKGEKGETLL